VRSQAALAANGEAILINLVGKGLDPIGGKAGLHKEFDAAAVDARWLLPWSRERCAMLLRLGVPKTLGAAVFLA
jgi:hypothetical protein